MAATLPHALEQRLAALVPRVRTLRVARGASLCLLAAVAATAGVLALDALVHLPATVRGLFIAVWVTTLGVLVWRLVVAPWQAEISLTEVARELSKRLPEFGARLGAVVTHAPNGTSDAVLAALTEDTARRAKTIDLARAIPTHPAVLRVCAAILTLLAFLMLTGLVPGSAERLRRVAMPWARPPAASVRVVVTSGEPVVRRGGPVTLTAFAEKLDSRAPAPETAVLFVRESLGLPEQLLPMTANEAQVFHVTRPEVTNDFEYRVQIGGATSDWFRVTVLDAVELAEGTRLEVWAPDYAKRPKRTLPHLIDFDALEFGRLSAQLKFTQPAAAAYFEWRAGGDTRAEQIGIELAADRMSGVASVGLRASGELRLVLLREVDGKKLRTTTTANVRVTPDKAPWFEQVSGIGPRPRTARPNARLPVTLVACDDVCVSGAVLEYTLDWFDSATVTVPIPLTRTEKTRATGKLDFDLAPLAATSNRVLFRIRVTDNRNADDPKLGPQEAIFPATGWSELRFNASAPPLEEQDIVAQRGSFHAAAEAARDAVRDAADTITAVRAEALGRGTLAVDHTIRLNEAQKKLRRGATILTDLARDASLTIELRPLAATVREIAEQELRGAEEATLRAGADADGRADAFAAAVKHLGAAGDKLSTVLTRNATLGGERLDRARLGALASDQAALAAADGPDRLARQQELLARLRRIVADSDALKRASESATGEEARRLARAIDELGAALRDLDTATRQTTTDARAVLVADISRAQEELTTRAGKLFAALDTPARLAGVAPPKFEDFRRVTELAARGKTVEALTELEKQAQALERIAAEFDTWSADRADPKKGARHLALWQDDLLTRFRAATKGAEFGALPEGTKGAFRTEQKAIHTALGLLPLPPDPSVKAVRDSASVHTGKAHDFLSADGRGAEPAMRLAAEALNRVADRAPTAAARLAQALREFEKFRPEQDPLANAVELTLRGADGQPTVGPAAAKKLGALADRQRKAGSLVAALDLPGLGARQARVGAVIGLAVADLREGSPFDIQASQLLVRREFERLKFVLEGNPSPDVKAEELHRKISALADALDLHGPNLSAKLLEPAYPIVQDAAKQIQGLTAPDAAVLLHDAKQALQAAEAAFRDGSKPDEVRRRVRAGADALDKLVARFGGSETDLERVQRLAGYRRLAAVRAKELIDAKAPANVSASEEAVRQLVREWEELAHTRTGSAGQLNKKRVLDQYARLRAKLEPDRSASDQRALADALEELAAKMADVAELATVPAPADPPSPAEPDDYLPSRPLADSVRALAKHQRALHDQLTGFARALADRLRPTAHNPFTDLEARQRTVAADLLALVGDAALASTSAGTAADRLRVGDAGGAKAAADTALKLTRELARTGEGKAWGPRAAELAERQQSVLERTTALVGASTSATAQQLARAIELAGRASELARTLELAATGLAPSDAPAKALGTAAALLKDAEKLLRESARKTEGAESVDAARLRAEVAGRFRGASSGLAGPVPEEGSNPALGGALRRAELAMRTALDDLASARPAEPAMRAAARALTAAKDEIGSK